MNRNLRISYFYRGSKGRPRKTDYAISPITRTARKDVSVREEGRPEGRTKQKGKV